MRESAQAMDINHLSQQTTVNIIDQNVSKLVKPSINLNIEPKIITPNSIRIKIKSHSQNSQWLTIRGSNNKN